MATSQELLLYKGGGSLDQIRAQTTGNILLEAGVGARTWPTNTPATAASVFISGTAGTGLTQVGINTNAPGATLDVAVTSGLTGSIRAPIISSLQMFTSSIQSVAVSSTAVQASTISATLFPVYYNSVISTVNTGNTMFLPASASGSYLFIISSNVSGSNVNVSLPTTLVPTGAHFIIKHKGATGGTNFVNIQNTASILAASTTTTIIYSGIEWLSLGISGVS